MNQKEYNLVIPSKLEKLIEVEKVAEKVAAVSRLSKDQCNNIAIAVTEAVGNAIVHGNHKNARKKVRIHFGVTNKAITVEVQDEGKTFVFSLRKGMKWFDGTPLTADDASHPEVQDFELT